jgi:hypothetical protein
MQAIQKFNITLQSTTLAALLTATFLLSQQTEQQQQQTERFFTSLAQEQRTTTAYVQYIDAQVASQQVRLVRIESDLCRDDVQKTFIQCPL